MAPARPNAAFYFAAHNYRTAGDMVVGRQSASGGFLRGFIRHGGTDALCCYADGPAGHEEFLEFVKDNGGDPDNVTTCMPVTLDRLSGVGTLFRPGPGLGPLAWTRRHFDPRGFSLVGITHTVSEAMALDVIGDLLVAPVQPWDALVCTSRCVKAVVDRVLADWGDYLEQRFGARPVDIRRPVIALGVDAAALAALGDNAGARADLRRRMGMADEDVALLYAGRLDHVEKANPVAMLLAAETAAQATSRKVHLMQAGQASTPEMEAAFKHAATALAPSVNHHFIDGAMTELYDGAWAAADIFISLSDNIQESFGLTPIEAMAAGLPCVVSDWNGYRETVRDGADGFTVPSAAPPPGAGAELGYLYGSGFASYPVFTGGASQSTSVDPAAAAEALGRLISDAGLRRRMGDSGRQRAEGAFDWRHVVAAHQDLWAELAEVRQTAQETAPRTDAAPAWPLRPDPFAAFQAHPSAVIGGETRLAAAAAIDARALAALRGSELATPLAAMLLDIEATARVMDGIPAGDGITVAELAKGIDEDQLVPFHLTLGWLAKMGFVRVVAGDAGGPATVAPPFGRSENWKDLGG